MRNHPVARICLTLCLAGSVFAFTLVTQPSLKKAHASPDSTSLSTIYGLHVSGNQLLNGNGDSVRLLGVNRSGSEYKCVNNCSSFPSLISDYDGTATQFGAGFRDHLGSLS
ncbi:hypothetical protein [Tengunoibacter tsumagoiensis]|uniref:Beta/gamma crystallin 'Greek key' domain-containing protein n=1 Tax=Tengunoibacter tsumagoiensis TaxID=2014871 RepID=A0A402A170_9CHLR|nr:hypothetical protein [Tengunoibacter tsumagoiensis]GCE12761.1 hypothetical protein KTT_26200 [Tengunoibacter tsumagoiensis]